MPTERFQFTGEGGHQLAAALDLPEREPLAYALFAHCFTCGKDVLAAKRIAPALAAKGIAVLRFDFTGLGSSEGDFANSTFSSNVADLVRAADHLRETRKAPIAPDRPQPRRRRDPRRRRADSGRQGRRHHRGALRSRPCHRPVQGSHRGHPQAWRGRSLARRPSLPHQARIPRRYRRAWPDGACHQLAQGAAGHAFADRRHRRHRQCHAHFRHGQTSQELCVAGGRRPSVDRQARRRLCRRCHRRLGRALSRCRSSRRRLPVPATRRARSWCAKPATANSSRRFRRARIACWPMSRSRPVARTPDLAPMISCWRPRRLHIDDHAALCRSQIAAAGAATVTLEAQQDPCGGLRRMRNQGRHARPDRSR